MEAKEGSTPEAGKEIAADETAEVAGGATASLSTSCGASVSNEAATPGAAMIGIYDGMVELTTHVIETVAGAK